MKPFVTININGIDLEVLKIGTLVYHRYALLLVSEVFILKNNELLYRLVDDNDTTYLATKEEAHNNYCEEITNEVLEAEEEEDYEEKEQPLNLDLADKILKSFGGVEGYRSMYAEDILNGTYNFADLSKSFSKLILQDNGDINKEVVSQIEYMANMFLTQANLLDIYSVSDDILKNSLFVSSYNKTNYQMFILHYDFLYWLDLMLISN